MGDASNQRLLLVDVFHTLVKVGRVALGQFHHSVYARLFQQIGILLGHALDAIQVNMVHPGEDEALGDPGLIGDILAAAAGRAINDKIRNRVNFDGPQLLPVSSTDSFDVLNGLAEL